MQSLMPIFKFFKKKTNQGNFFEQVVKKQMAYCPSKEGLLYDWSEAIAKGNL